MAFYLSPLVDVQEIDLTTTIPAVATSIGVQLMRMTYKGPEGKPVFIANEDELIRTYGKPTTNKYCYQSLMAGAGFLKYGRNFYTTRVMPVSASFADTVATSGTFTDSATAGPAPWYTSGFTHYDQLNASTGLNIPEGEGLKSMDIGNPDDEYFGDPDSFGDEEVPAGYTMSIISSSRGEWGTNVRVAFVTKADYDRLNNSTTNELYDDDWYPYERTDGPDDDLLIDVKPGWMGYESQSVFNSVMKIDSPLEKDTDFLVVVQERAQGENDWESVESWNVSTIISESDGEGRSKYCETLINTFSRYIKVSLADMQMDSNWIISTPMWEYLDNGINGHDHSSNLDPLPIADKSTDVDEGTQMLALDLYANPEEIDVSIFIDADSPIGVKKYMIEICEDRKDCMAIIDCQYSMVVDNRDNEVEELTEWRKGIGMYPGINNMNENTSYAALYGNWIEVYDKYQRKYHWIPLSGHIAGIYAKTDYTRDPWWAPAGLNRAILTSVRRLAWNPKMGHRDMLYKSGINPVVSFSGQGKVVWGQKTLLDKSSAFNRVNVRRLFIVLEKAISTAAKYFLFEFNDRITRSQLQRMIEPFLEDVQQRRGIYDFKVVCDETNNTPERIDRNELWCTIFIKPTRVAEFIVLQFVAMKTGMTFEEAAEEVINFQG